MKKKILGICGSTRANATEYALKEALNILENEYSFETDFFTVRGKKITPCIHCNRCVKENTMYCPPYEKDDMHELYEKYFSADGIILASPVFEMNISPQLIAVFSRFRFNYPLTAKNPHYFGKKVGIAIAVGGTRNGGQETAINMMHGYFHTNGYFPLGGSMGVYTGASVWSQDKVPFDYNVDPIGIDNVRKLARKMGYTMNLIE